MTTYAVQADLLHRLTAAELVQLTDDARSGTVNAAIVSGALVEATGQIDSYVRARYQTPLQTSSTATRLCRDIAVYLLYQRRPQQMKDTVRQAYEDAVSFLKDIATGKDGKTRNLRVRAQGPDRATRYTVGEHQRHQNIPARPYLVFRPEDPARLVSGTEAYLRSRSKAVTA